MFIAFNFLKEIGLGPFNLWVAYHAIDIGQNLEVVGYDYKLPMLISMKSSNIGLGAAARSYVDMKL